MKTSYASAIALALATLAAGHVMAADVAPTAHVQAGINDASGDVVEPITGLKLREINPARYAANSAVKGKTRAQVQAELAEARRNDDGGDVVEPVTGLKMRDINPSQYAENSAVKAKTREQVRAELAKAQSSRNAGDTVEPVTGMTLREINPSRYSNANS
ncbi:MAG: DUF4148 domain-containing protein [Rhodoferax sp.]|nr:DUF4148 domain-containing protein [Rhodoferax sp.]MDP3652497.1 DUF4148 domain-containing protein [Rhodoferax sp.]